MPKRSRVELYAAIRCDLRAGVSHREVQRRHRVGWETVARAEASASPQARKPYPKRGSKLDPFAAVIDAILLADLDAPRKHRHTATRIYRRASARRYPAGALPDRPRRPAAPAHREQELTHHDHATSRRDDRAGRRRLHRHRQPNAAVADDPQPVR